MWDFTLCSCLIFVYSTGYLGNSLLDDRYSHRPKKLSHGCMTSAAKCAVVGEVTKSYFCALKNKHFCQLSPILGAKTKKASKNDVRQWAHDLCSSAECALQRSAALTATSKQLLSGSYSDPPHTTVTPTRTLLLILHSLTTQFWNRRTSSYSLRPLTVFKQADKNVDTHQSFKHFTVESSE